MSGICVLTDRRYLRQRMPAALIERLRRRGAAVTVLLTDRLVAEVAGPTAVDLGGCTVVVPRTRDRFALSLLRQAELAGARPVNSWAAVQAVRDKPYAALVLADAGIPAPRTFLTDRLESLAGLPATAWPVLVKPSYGDNARGIVRVDGPADLARLDWRDGMVIAQHYVDVARVDVKLYGAGEQVWAVRRRSPLVAPDGLDSPVPLPVTEQLRRLALDCRDAFGLELYGVDVLPSPDGPLVVDVNDFPNYTGVAEAPDVLADRVLARAARGAQRMTDELAGR